MRYFVKGNITATGTISVGGNGGDIVAFATEEFIRDAVIIDGDLNIEGDLIITDNTIWAASGDVFAHK